MYRTAVIRQYDVLDTVFIACVITEYSDTPGTLPPIEYVLSTSIPGRGDDDRLRWLYEGLTALAAESQA